MAFGAYGAAASSLLEVKLQFQPRLWFSNFLDFSNNTMVSTNLFLEHLEHILIYFVLINLGSTAEAFPICSGSTFRGGGSGHKRPVPCIDKFTGQFSLLKSYEII